MFNKKWLITYFEYGFFVSSVLSIITLLATFIAPHTTNRLVYFFFNYLFINLLILLSFAFLANHLHWTRGGIISKTVFVLVTACYSFFYIMSSVSFINTGQAIHSQSILFTLKINPVATTIFILLSISLAIGTVVFLLNKKIDFIEVKDNKALWSKRILATSIIMLITFSFIVSPNLNFENKIVKMYNSGEVLFWNAKPIQSEPIFEKNPNLTSPNVVFILLESVSADRLSSYGYSRNVTPNIDSFAEEGIMFRNMYSVATHSDYAQPSYLSSNYVLENDYRNLFMVQKNQNAVWQIFDSLGYNTYYFSSQDDRWAGMGNYFNYSSLDIYWYSLTDNITDYGIGLGKKDYDHKTVDTAINKLNDSITFCYDMFNQTTNLSNTECKVKITAPIFVYVNLQATHQPFSYPAEYAYYLPDDSSLFGSSEEILEAEVNKYDNSLRYVDFQVGRIKDYFESIGQINNTLFVITSDHGHDLYNQHESKGHGLSVYNDEIKVPFILYFPSIEKREITERESHIDVLPTILDILDKNISRDFRGKIMNKENRFFFYAQNHMYLIGMIENNTKVIIDLNRNNVEVYDLSIDLNEEYNLIYEKNYNEQILTLLMWHYCQLNYFSADEKPEKLKKYCEVFN